MHASTDSISVDVAATKQLARDLATEASPEVLREELRKLEERRDGTPPMSVISVLDALYDIADDLVTVSEAIGNPSTDDKSRHEGAVRRLAEQLMGVRAGLDELNRLDKVARVTDRLAHVEAAARTARASGKAGAR